MTGSIRIGGREVRPRATRAATCSTRWPSATTSCPPAAVEPVAASSSATRPARGAAPARRPRDVRHRQVAPSSTRCRGWRSGSSPTATNRPTARSGDGDPADRARRRAGARALPRRASRSATGPSSRRTSTTRTWCAAWARPGDGAHDRGRRAARSSGSVAVMPLHGWSSHVGEVRLVVDPDAPRPRRRARARPPRRARGAGARRSPSSSSR